MHGEILKNLAMFGGNALSDLIAQLDCRDLRVKSGLVLSAEAGLEFAFLKIPVKLILKLRRQPFFQWPASALQLRPDQHVPAAAAGCGPPVARHDASGMPRRYTGRVAPDR